MTIDSNPKHTLEIHQISLTLFLKAPFYDKSHEKYAYKCRLYLLKPQTGNPIDKKFEFQL